MTEIWRSIPNFPDHKVSNTGKVSSKRGLLRPNRLRKGYLQVDLRHNGLRKAALVHRLVGEAFIANPLHLAEINHKDLNKANNDVTNLEWISRRDNIQHAKANGVLGRPTCRGELNVRAKLSSAQVAEVIHLRSTGLTLREIGDRYGIDQSTVSRYYLGKHKFFDDMAEYIPQRRL